MTQDMPIVTGPTSDISNFYSQGNGHSVSNPTPGADMARSDTLVHAQVSKLKSAEHQGGSSLPLINSDPTCTPPITAGRQRTLILCFDGTGDQYDEDNSNIVNIFSFLKKDERDVQMCYYQPGIGTYTDHHYFLGISKFFAQLSDFAIAWSLDVHIQAGYEFLMQNYKAGDRICLFGFSRGAYTARALSGMLTKVGLLPAYNNQQVHFALKMYKNDTTEGWNLSQQFKKAFCTDVKIDFLGVFDTVESVGLFGKKLPFTASNYGIRIFRHAMALDERRARFKVAHWTSAPEEDDETSSTPSWMKKKTQIRKGRGQVWKEVEDVETDAKEVWFAGCHCDVGGGSVKNDTSNSLARIPLRWMIRETFRCRTGILWNIEALKTIGLDADKLYPTVVIPPLGSSTPPDSLASNDLNKVAVPVDVVNAEHHDALSPLYDQLALKPFWWLLEFLPVKGKIQLPPPHDLNSWRDITFINYGRGRLIPRSDNGSWVHRSVNLRAEHDPKYKWKAWGEMTPVWID